MAQRNFSLSPDVFTPAVTRAHIREVDSRISAFTIAMRKLQNQRHFLKAHLDAYVYPVLTLPNEIISEIFLQSLSRDDKTPWAPKSPLFLGHICRKWREIALSTPWLWSDIDLPLGPSATHENRLRLLETWLTRSRDCPLSISIADYCLERSFSAHKFVDAILPHSKRWQEITLIIPFSDIPLHQYELPLLRDLTIGASHSSIDLSDTSRPLIEFHRAPRLREVSTIGLGPKLVVFPWELLTDIGISDVQFPHDLVPILRAAINVTSFRIEVISSSEEPAANLPDIPPLVYLKSLVLHRPIRYRIDTKAQTQLLEMLTLPALNHLRVTEGCFNHSPVSAIRSLVDRSGCQWNTLRITIEYTELSEAYYRAALPSVGNLEVHPPQFFVPPEFYAPEVNSGSEDGDTDEEE
ncbi:hypothetical protein C8R44DRAFT_94713 [Mycena epipterygia]|nr:hypothetical protein C8R44DRAFT_94713 [Mycena epipterygia]